MRDGTEDAIAARFAGLAAEGVEDDLRAAFAAGVTAGDPSSAVARHLPPPPPGKTVVVGAGKAALVMAAAVESAYPAPVSGLVIAPYGAPGPPLSRIRYRRASHPLPDDAAAAATRDLLDCLQSLTRDDLLIVLLSGGGSALLTAADGIGLPEKRELTLQLMKAGATIRELNVVRKHLSRVKGGQLARAAGSARIHALIVSDVAGDDPSTIASGPTSPDPSTFGEALQILERHGISAPAARIHLERGIRGQIAETPKPGDECFARVENRIVLANRDALAAAAFILQARGWVIDAVEPDSVGEARDAARRFSERARALRPGHALVTGGELTVTVRGRGRGGPNMEFLLALTQELAGETGIHALAADTDGSDGSTEAAGACIGPLTAARGRALGLDAAHMLDDNDSLAFFDRMGALIRTGATGTNLNDIRIILRR